MSGKLSGVLFLSLVILSIMHPVTTQAFLSSQIETPSDESDPLFFESSDDGSIAQVPLNSLNAELDLGLGYCLLTGEGIKDNYTGMGQAGVGISFLFSHKVRTFLRLDYTTASGDPFENIPGFDSSNEMKIKSVPMTFGFRFNISQNQKMRVQIGLGIQIAWQQEETLRVLNSNEIGTSKASAFNGGFVGTFGPEFYLGDSGNLLGLEFGFGGAKGSINGDDYSHDIDLTGFTTRVYYILAL